MDSLQKSEPPPEDSGLGVSPRWASEVEGEQAAVVMLLLHLGISSVRVLVVLRLPASAA